MFAHLRVIWRSCEGHLVAEVGVKAGKITNMTFIHEGVLKIFSPPNLEKWRKKVDETSILETNMIFDFEIFPKKLQDFFKFSDFQICFQNHRDFSDFQNSFKIFKTKSDFQIFCWDFQISDFFLYMKECSKYFHPQILKNKEKKLKLRSWKQKCFSILRFSPKNFKISSDFQILRFFSKSSRFFRFSEFFQKKKKTDFQIFLLRFSDFRFVWKFPDFPPKFRDSSDFVIFQKLVFPVE